MKRPLSDIPQDVSETQIEEYREQGQLVYFRVTECILNSQVVGWRAYDGEGILRVETPLKNGKKHGREKIWDERGMLESVEPYAEGQLHGLAKQYNRKGKVIGTYRFVRGTGFDVWRFEREDGSIGISEIFSVQDSALHGYEWGSGKISAPYGTRGTGRKVNFTGLNGCGTTTTDSREATRSTGSRAKSSPNAPI